MTKKTNPVSRFQQMLGSNDSTAKLKNLMKDTSNLRHNSWSFIKAITARYRSLVYKTHVKKIFFCAT
jgi:hypothetical protein